jgi:hypothetical protein
MLRRTALGAAFAGLCGQMLAAEVSIPGSTVSFQAPEGFTELTKTEIQSKWLRGSPPLYAIGNPRRTTTVAYDIKNHKIPESELEEALNAFEKMFNRVIPGISWKKKEVVVIKGKRWMHLEMTSFAMDTDVYNIILCTPYEGKLLIFNFNSTKEDFPQLQAELRKSIESITLGK